MPVARRRHVPTPKDVRTSQLLSTRHDSQGEARVLKEPALPSSDRPKKEKREKERERERERERDSSFSNLTGHPSGLCLSGWVELLIETDLRNSRDSIVDVPWLWVVVAWYTGVLDTRTLRRSRDNARGERGGHLVNASMQIDGWVVRLGWSNASWCSLMSPITAALRRAWWNFRFSVDNVHVAVGLTREDWLNGLGTPIWTEFCRIFCSW